MTAAGVVAFAARPSACPATEHLMGEWALWMRAAAMSQRTIDSRLQLVRLLEARAGVPAAAISWQDLASFFAALVDTAAPGTRSTYFNHLRRWFAWLVIMEHRLDNPTARLHPPRTPRRQPRPISTDELRRVLTSGRFYGRTRTMILLGAYQGLRVHEIAKIRGEDFTSTGLNVIGKGGVEAVIPVHPIIETERARYPSRGWWFPSHTEPATHVLPRSVSTVIGQALRRAGVDATAHQLRHFFGTEVHRASGGQLRVAQELLRHASPATTALYTRVDDAERRAALLALPI